MIIYKSNYFNIEIPFPKKWRLYCWLNSRVSNELNKRFTVKYQITDDDIPKNKDELRLLFSSIYIEKSKAGPISAELSIAACYREKTLSLREEIKEDSGEKGRVIGSESILGIEAQSLYVIKDMGSYHLWKKIISWEALPSLWLEAVIHGNSQENFNRAESIFKQIKRKSE